MAEFVGDMEDWCLEAIVRESSGDHFKKIVDIKRDDHKSFLEFSGIDDEFLSSFPEIFDLSTGSSDELEDLYKPFYPVVHSLPGVEFQENRPEKDVEDYKQANESDHSSGTSCVSKVNAAYTPKYKRRKNQQKRVMIQVSAEGVGSDMWAWRKYGQKPIKGSPYPRSYYRCSSSKGCLARKQVEQSCSDPGMFIITYTAEHSHSQPTRRNSLAGTIRQKFPNPKSPINAKQETNNTSPNPLLLIPSTRQEILPHKTIKQEEAEDILLPVLGDTQHEFITSDLIFNDEFFSGLDVLDGFINSECNGRSCSSSY